MMKKLLVAALFMGFMGMAQAQAPRDIDASITYVEAPAAEMITSYQCVYWLTEDGVDGANISCDFAATSPVVPHVVSLTATTADKINVQLNACNANGCSGPTVIPSTFLVPAMDASTAPTGVVVTNVKI